MSTSANRSSETTCRRPLPVSVALVLGVGLFAVLGAVTATGSPPAGETAGSPFVATQAPSEDFGSPIIEPVGTSGLGLDAPGDPLWRMPLSTSFEMVYRTWSIREPDGESKLNQFALPIYAHLWAREDLTLSYLFNVASSSLDFANGGTNTLSGLTDGKFDLTYYLPDPRFSLAAGWRIPTGQSLLTTEEDLVARQLLDRMLTFYVRRYGEGTDFELRGGFADSWRPGFTYAAGLSYLFKGSFDVLNPTGGGASSYDPGNELAFFGSARWRVAAGHLDARLRYHNFQRDRRDGRDELEEGQLLSLVGVVSQEMFRGVAELGVELLFKGDTVVFSGGQETSPLRDVGGDIYRLSTGFSGRLTRHTTLGGVLRLDWFGESASGTGDGFLFEIGPTLLQRLAPGVGLRADWIFADGSTEQSTIDLRGNVFSVGIVLGGGR